MAATTRKIIVTIVDANGNSIEPEPLTFKPPQARDVIIQEILDGGHGAGHLLDEEGDNVTRGSNMPAGHYKYRVTGVGMSLLSARQAILRPIPGISVRTSPRSSLSRTSTKTARTYSGLRAWPEFHASMDHMAGALNNSEHRYTPVQLPGPPKHALEYPPAADESEIRAPLLPVSILVNSVAKSMGIDMELVGGGSNRGASYSDWFVRRAGTPSGVGDPAPKKLKLNQRNQQSSNIFACMEVKGPWQVALAPGDDVTTVTGAQAEGVRSALQQLYGYMVLEEAPLGILTLYNTAVMVKRATDVTDKTLLVSETITLDNMLLALLTLLDQAKQLQGMKASLPRNKVPSTPSNSSGSRSSPPPNASHNGLPNQDMLHAPNRPESSPTQPPTDCQGGPAPPAQDVAAGSSDSCVLSSGSACTGSDGGGSDHAAVETWPVPQQGLPVEWVEVCSFGSVGLTGTLLGAGLYGKTLEGMVNGQPVAVKMFDPKFEGAELAFLRELGVYRHLEKCGLQGQVVPRLVRFGVFEFTGAVFLATSYAGETLSHVCSDEQGLSEKQQQDVRGVISHLHRAGVVHGDVRRANFTVGLPEAPGLKAIDFERSHLQHAMSAEDWACAVRTENEEVERVCGSGQEGRT